MRTEKKSITQGRYGALKVKIPCTQEKEKRERRREIIVV
jgi:hypothetical protein